MPITFCSVQYSVCSVQARSSGFSCALGTGHYALLVMLSVFVVIKNADCTRKLRILFWCFGGGATPDPIPNSAVKPTSTDGTRKGRVGRRQNKVLKLQPLTMHTMNNKEKRLHFASHVHALASVCHNCGRPKPSGRCPWCGAPGY